MPEYDLTNKIAEHLDRHMIFPLLEFLSSRKIYDEKSILAMKLELLQNTNMVDFAVDCYKNLYPSDEIPERKCFFLQNGGNRFEKVTLFKKNKFRIGREA